MSDRNFDNRTLFIGDNLDLLRGVNSGCVDLIYLDPPFNSKRIYNAPLGSRAAGAKFDDTWSMDSVKREWAELMEAADPAVHHTVVGAGLSHSESMQAYLSFMALRLVEMRRVLADTGAIYLHCDPTASHYLKQLMDCIFGRSNFRNEITWQRTTGRRASRHWGNATDIMLYYAGPRARFEPQYGTLADSAMAHYRHDDNDGRGPYRHDNVNAPGSGHEYDLGKGEAAPSRGYRMPLEQAQRMVADGTLVVRPGRVPVSKRYLRDSKGTQHNNVWTDIPPVVGANAKERTGWPTQKPLALLRRIIEASSNPGDMILDPFAGCGTACIAAEQLDRQWAGIDIDSKAEEVTRDRLAQEAGEGTLFAHPVTVTATPPRRTDPEQPTRTKNSVLRAILWNRLPADMTDSSRRVCPPCGRPKYSDDFELDHIVPRAKNGADTDDNIQLICGSCNNLKGVGAMTDLAAKLRTR